MKPLLKGPALLVIVSAGHLFAAPPSREGERKGDKMPPAGSSSYRPGVPGADSQRPSGKPAAVRPDMPSVPRPVPETRPAPAPGSAGGLPSQGGEARPPSPGRPEVKPAPVEPGRPAVKPAPVEPGRPEVKPAPVEPGRPAVKPAPVEPGRPAVKPWPPGDDFLNIRPNPWPVPPDHRPGHRPGIPSTKPVPVPPGINVRPPVYPVHRPVRPPRPQPVVNVWQNHTTVWNQWTVQNNLTINQFSVNRPVYWGGLNQYASSPNCWQHWNQPDWWDWRRRLWEYRRNRAYELWNAHYRVSDQLFDLHWWRYCPWAANYGRIDQVPVWWWWNPVTWEQLTAHVRKLPREQEPLLFDPGVSVVIQRDRVYRNGRDAGPAWKFVQSARHEANPDFRWEPPFPGGRHQWLPLGVWALTHEEQGAATMFLQLSISSDGLISGGFTNVQTGEDLPVKGGTNRSEQRVAFHIGDRTDTVIECGLAHLVQDVAGAFVHFANGSSQTWLLVRLPGPGVPPGAVRIPHLERR